MMEVETLQDLVDIDQSKSERVFVKETHTVWKYCFVLMVWGNTGLAE